MNTFEHIPVSVVHPPSTLVAAILNEIDSLLTRLIEHHESAAIDLRSLPLFPGDDDHLKALLGEGEVSVRLNALGPSEIYETQIPGVWWCAHFNEAEEKIAEFIEITRIPTLLQTDVKDLQLARKKLAPLIKRIPETEYS